jgi:hypothetical protein
MPRSGLFEIDAVRRREARRIDVGYRRGEIVARMERAPIMKTLLSSFALLIGLMTGANQAMAQNVAGAPSAAADSIHDAPSAPNPRSEHAGICHG